MLKLKYEDLTHWKRPWCWDGLGAGGEGDNRGWDGWMASLTRWAWVWVNSGSWWWTRRPGVLRFMGTQRVGHDWATELNWIVEKLIMEHFSCCEWVKNIFTQTNYIPWSWENSQIILLRHFTNLEEIWRIRNIGTPGSWYISFRPQEERWMQYMVGQIRFYNLVN